MGDDQTGPGDEFAYAPPDEDVQASQGAVPPRPVPPPRAVPPGPVPPEPPPLRAPAPVVLQAPARPRRWIVAVATLAVLVVVGGVSTAQTYSTGKRWQERAQDLEATLTETTSELTATAGELEGTRTDLTRSNQRVADLRREKGIAEDERDTFASLAVRSKVVADRLEQCANGIADVMVRLGDLGPSPALSTLDNLLRYAEGVADFCDEASSLNAELNRELDSLAGV